MTRRAAAGPGEPPLPARGLAVDRWQGAMSAALGSREALGVAVFSPDRVHRYWLCRRWDGASDACSALFIMLNPSTADARVLDPTVTRCMSWAMRRGLPGCEVCNVFALRSTDPAGLRKSADPVGPANDAWIAAAASRARAGGAPVVVAWGNHASFLGRDAAVRTLLAGVRGLTPLCLGLTGAGQPRHPLYVPSARAAEDFLLS